MKRNWLFRGLIWAACAAGTAGTLRPQTPASPTSLTWPVQEALLFDGGGLLAHEGTVKLTGVSGAFALTGLTRELDPLTVRIALPDGWSLGTLGFQTVWIEADKKAVESEFEALRVKRDAVYSTVRMREALLNTYGEELAMLAANRAFGGNEAILVEDMREMADFWRNRVKELNYLRLELDLELVDLREEVAEWDRKMAEVSKRLATPPGSLHFFLEGPEGGSGKVRVEYVTTAADWVPEYDVSVNAAGKVELVRYAQVVQATGMDWDRVGLEVTVGGGVAGMDVPVLDPWILRVGRPDVADKVAYRSYAAMPAMLESRGAFAEDAKAVEFSGIIGEGPIERFAFRPQGRVSIKSNGLGERVELERFTLPATLVHIAVPAESDQVYQVASSDAWIGARLVPGEAQVLAGGVFLGRIDLELPAAGDTLEIPLGPSPDVRVKRQRDLERSRTVTTALRKRTTTVWKITLENGKKTAVTVRVQDRVPVATTEEISIEAAPLTGGTLDPTTGIVTWEIELKPGEVRTWDFGYVVEYPRKLRVMGL